MTGGCEDAAAVGGVCFGVRAGETTVQLDIADASGLPTAANVQMEDAAGATVASAILCGSGVFDVTPTAAQVHVVLYDSVLGFGGCFTVSGGTTGTVTATFA